MTWRSRSTRFPAGQRSLNGSLHFDIDERDERAKREVVGEVVAYLVGRYFGLDTSNSAFYLAAWKDEESSVIQQRLGRINSVAAEFTESVNRLIKTPGQTV